MTDYLQALLVTCMQAKNMELTVLMIITPMRYKANTGNLSERLQFKSRQNL